MTIHAPGRRLPALDCARRLRSTGPALAPLVGAVVSGFVYKWLGGDVKLAATRAAE